MKPRKKNKKMDNKVDTDTLFTEITSVVSKFISESRSIGMDNVQRQKENDVMQKLDNVREALRNLKKKESPDARNEVLKAIAELYKTMVAVGYEEKLSPQASVFPSSPAPTQTSSLMSMFGFTRAPSPSPSPSQPPDPSSYKPSDSLSSIVERHFPEVKGSTAETLDQRIKDSLSPPQSPPPPHRP